MIDIINIKNLREDIKRLADTLKANHKNWLIAERQRLSKELAQKRQEENISRATDAQSRLDELRNQPQSPERDAELIQLIRDSCQWKFDNRR